MDLIRELRDKVIAELDAVRESPDYQDLDLKWQLVQPEWGLEEGPLNATVDDFMDKADAVLNRVMDAVADATQKAREGTDPQTAWGFRHSAIMAIQVKLPLLAYYIATNATHRALEDEIGGRYVPGSFEAWLEEHLESDDDIGDLARSALTDPEWPLGSNDLPTYMRRLIDAEAPGYSIVALSRAWEIYTSEEKLDSEGVPHDDFLTPEEFELGAQQLAAIRDTPEYLRHRAFRDTFGVELGGDGEVEDEEFEDKWMYRFFRDHMGEPPPRAAALAYRMLMINEFLDEHQERLEQAGFLSVNEENGTPYADAMLVMVLSTTPLYALPRDEDGALDYDEVIEMVNEYVHGYDLDDQVE